MTTEHPVPDHPPADTSGASSPERVPVSHIADRSDRRDPATQYPRPILVFGDD